MFGFIKKCTLKSMYLILIIIVILLSGCNFQEGNLNNEINNEEIFNKMIFESAIDLMHDENWRRVYPYIENLGKPVNEIKENYKKWDCLGATAAEGVKFKDATTNVVYAFWNEDFDNVQGDSYESYKLVLNGDETCIGIGTSMNYFFPEFKNTTSWEDSMDYLVNELGINKNLFMDLEGDEYEGDYNALLLENRLTIYITTGREGLITSDSWFEIGIMDGSDEEYYKTYLYNLWIERNQ